MTTSCGSVRPRLIADANILIAAEKGQILGNLGGLRICTTTTVVETDLLDQRTFGSDAYVTLRDAGIEVDRTFTGLVSDDSLSQSLSDADVSCFKLAQRLGGALLTEDRKLIQACDSAGVTVRQMHRLITTALNGGHLTADKCLNAFRLWRADDTEGDWYERPDMREIEARCSAGG